MVVGSVIIVVPTVVVVVLGLDDPLKQEST